jgi:hypothetical protein
MRMSSRRYLGRIIVLAVLVSVVLFAVVVAVAFGTAHTQAFLPVSPMVSPLPRKVTLPVVRLGHPLTHSQHLLIIRKF